MVSANVRLVSVYVAVSLSFERVCMNKMLVDIVGDVAYNERYVRWTCSSVG